MGLLDKLRGEFVDIVEWVDDSQRTLVWRFPRYENEIKNGAELVVRPGQNAIFVDRGEIADVFLVEIRGGGLVTGKLRAGAKPRSAEPDNKDATKSQRKGRARSEQQHS